MRKVKQYYNRGPVGVPANGTPERAAVDMLREAVAAAPIKSHRKPKVKRKLIDIRPAVPYNDHGYPKGLSDVH